MKNNIIDIKLAELTTTEPVTLTEAKAQLIITFADDDTLITRLITAARRAIENYTCTSIISKRITLLADIREEWELPYGPVVALESVMTRSGTQGSGPASYATADTTWQTDGAEFLSFSSPNYNADFTVNSRFGRYNQEPCIGTRYKIIYTTGYDVCPQDLKQAILLEVAWLYENKGDVSTGVGSTEAIHLANPYRRQQWL